MDDNLEEVEVWDRRTCEIRTEPVYRGGTLRFLLRNPLGRLAMHTLLSTRLFTNLVTFRQRTSASRRDISPFLARYGIDATEFVRPADSFTSFADFFVRELRPETRPIAPREDAVVAPCDGRIQWICSPLKDDASFSVKGEAHTLGQLAGDEELGAAFAGGTLLGIYLAPFDYHRFCYPCDGTVATRHHLGARYYSVNAQSIASGFRVFDRNVRQATVLHRGSASWAMIEVAGFYAGGIVDLDDADPDKKRGMMKGYFRLGGSFIVLAFQAGDLQLDADIQDALVRGPEVRVRLGERIGILKPRSPAS